MSLGRPVEGMDELMSRPLTEAELERATAEMATPLEVRSRDRLSVLLFSCGKELLAVPARDVAKVVPSAPIRRVPHRSNSVFRGICNCDGELLLCFDLEQTLGLPAPEEDAPRVQVVVGAARDRWAFLVDRIVGVLELEERALQSAPATVVQARAGCVSALAATSEGTAALLDLQRLTASFRGAVA